MNNNIKWDIKKNVLVELDGEEMELPVVCDRRGGPVICPKPRRCVGYLAANLAMSLRWQFSNQQGDVCDSKSGAELLEMILMKEGYGEDQSSREIEPSMPFFCGTPPSRVSNPLVQDTRFGEEKLSPLSTLQLASPSSSSASPSAMNAGCARMKFGFKPAVVRVEGFECLSRDGQNKGITAVA